MTVEVPLPFDPKPKKRPRTVSDMNALKQAFLAARGSLERFMGMVSSGTSRTYTPKDTADYEKLLADASRLAMAGRAPMSCPVEVDLLFVLRGDAGEWPTSQIDGDADNLEKAVMDAMNGIVFVDDRLVVRATKEKACGEQPCVRAVVSPARPIS